MANQPVKFRKGVSTSLPKTPTNETVGAFLLETDTGNLYVDDSSTSRVKVKDNTKLPLSGGELTGPIKFNANSLPQKNLQYITGIDGFAEGGQLGWQRKEDFLSGYSEKGHTHLYAGSTTAGGAANSATKLSTGRKISLRNAVTSTATTFDGSSDITIPINSVSEAFLIWGGKNISDNFGPLDASLVPTLGANRMAFSKPEGITIEYSRDAGATWIDYEASNDDKKVLFTETEYIPGFVIGKSTPGDNYATKDCLLRIIYDTHKAILYTYLQKFLMYVSTKGCQDCWVTIETATNANPNTWETRVNKQTISGWTGWNVINTGFTTYGNTSSQCQFIKFTFGCNSVNDSHVKQYGGLTILKIYGYGGVGWTTPSNLAKRGVIYELKVDQSVAFPNYVASNTPNTENPTVSQFLVTNGTDNYFRKASLAHVKKSLGVDNTYFLKNLYTGNTRPTDANIDFSAQNNKITYMLATNKMTSNKPPQDATILNLGWDNDSYGTQLAIGSSTTTCHLYTRFSNDDGTYTKWNTFLDESNCNTYIKSYVDNNISTKTGVNSLINLLDVGTSNPRDDNYYIAQDADGTNKYYKRKHSSLYNYIKSKTDILYAPKEHSHDKYIKLNPDGTNNLIGTDNKINSVYLPTSTLVVGSKNTSSTNEAVSSNSIYLNLFNGTTCANSHNIVGAGATTVSSDANGKITINTPCVTIPTALPNPQTLTIKGNGTTSFTYNGSTSKTLNIKSGTNVSVLLDTSGNITINATNTDTKVTSVSNHYTPTGTTTLSASGATATEITNSSNIQVVAGITIDAKGHTTSVKSIGLKIPEIPEIPTTLPNDNSLTIQINSGAVEGTNIFTYDGKEDKSINIKEGDNIKITPDGDGNITIKGNYELANSEKSGLVKLSNELGDSPDTTVTQHLVNSIVTELKGNITALNSRIDETTQSLDISDYVRCANKVIETGYVDNTYTQVIDNNKISFNQGDTTIASIHDNKIESENVIVHNSINIGDDDSGIFEILVDSTNGLIIR